MNEPIDEEMIAFYRDAEIRALGEWMATYPVVLALVSLDRRALNMVVAADIELMRIAVDYLPSVVNQLVEPVLSEVCDLTPYRVTAPLAN